MVYQTVHICMNLIPDLKHCEYRREIIFHSAWRTLCQSLTAICFYRKSFNTYNAWHGYVSWNLRASDHPFCLLLFFSISQCTTLLYNDSGVCATKAMCGPWVVLLPIDSSNIVHSLHSHHSTPFTKSVSAAKGQQPLCRQLSLPTLQSAPAKSYSIHAFFKTQKYKPR